MTKNDRLQALQILLKLFQNRLSLSHSLSKNNDLSPFTKAICFGVCRHYYRLEALADKLITRRPDVEVWIALLMGLYELQFLDKPEYATVQETVGMLDKLKKPWAKGMVNAVLRRFCREKQSLLQQMQDDSAFSNGHPQWFIDIIKKDHPQHWQDILQANDAHPPLTLRVNQQQISRDEYLKILQSQGIIAKALQYSPAGIELDQPCDVTTLPGFAEGQVSVQDQAAQLAASLLELTAGLRVLDACCAPGGKTCHILEWEPLLAACVALDSDAARLRRVQDNLLRLRLKAEVRQGDGLKPADWWDGQLFDRILLDAPCSATGVIRRHPDIKLLRTPLDIEAIVVLQSNLLQTLWPLLKPGGLMVYATCSVINQENDLQIEKFLSCHSDASFQAEDKVWGKSTGHGWQIIPGQENCDGFFYSVLHKNEEKHKESLL